jgi:hypothetical protein
MTRAICAICLWGSVVALAASGSLQPAERAEPLEGLALADFVPAATRDTNADGIPDDIVARVIVPAAAAPEDVAAAANIAARLGFETMALSLPVVARDGEISRPAEVVLPILVGRENRFVRKLVEAGRLDLQALRPGQGVVAVVPSPLGGADGIVVVGADGEGTLAAADELAGRLPRLWAMSGITLSGVQDQAVAFLRSRGLAASDARVRSVVVDADRRGIARMSVAVSTAARDAARGVKAYEELDLAHRRGLEPRTLNFANAAEVALELVAGGRISGRAVVRRSGLNTRTINPPIDPDELAPDSPGGRGRAAEAPSDAAGRAFDLRSAYTIAGWFGDAYSDLIPDRVDATLVLGAADESLGAAHIAARLGLESTGITVPLAKLASRVTDPAREPSPILLGRSNRLVMALEKIGKAKLDDLRPGEGAIQIVPRAFGSATATVVAGADAAGTELAALHLARRVPYLWDTSRGAASLDDLSTEAARFLGARSGAGQASLALRHIVDVLDDLRGKPVETFDARLFLETRDAGLEAHLAEEVRKVLPSAAVTVASQGVTDPVPVFEDAVEMPWEVDDLRARFRDLVLPKVVPGAPVEIDVGVSESPEIRRALASELREVLTKAGAGRVTVRVLSSYKAGFVWLMEEVVPALKGKGVRTVRIQAARYEPDLTKSYKFFMEPTRWLYELFPIDEVIERELGIPRDAVVLEQAEDAKETFTVEGLDAGGKSLLRASFSPRVVEREYMDRFPGWSRVEVSTGWLEATINGQVVADERIETDPEKFWTHYQTKVLPRIYDYVMESTDRRPMPDRQPFHRDLDVEVWMSEPDFRIGVDEEHVSSIESLHEDLYFVTLDFFDALGRTTTRRRLAAPGKILPILHPERAGKGLQARVLYARNAAPRPALELAWREKGAAQPERASRPLERIDATPPSVMRLVAAADRVREVELRVEAKNDAEARRAVDALDALSRLHAAGLYRSALSYDRVDRVVVAVAVSGGEARRAVANTGAAAPATVRSADRKPASRLVPWDRVIGPDEAEEIVGRLAAYPAIRAYRAGRSYRGRPISVMEVTAPSGGDLVSRAKAVTWKPTIFITARQHANEVSSTNATLRLAELLATDPAYVPILQKLNVILHPVENPDGAAMAYELQKLTPTHMLHAGRYTALGMDVGSQVNLHDPLLPEALVRGRLWRDWLPDIYLNAHGYPSHEWVQRFAGHVPPAFKGDWTPRGFHIRVSGLRDPRYPGHAQVVEALREGIVREVNAHAGVKAMNLRYQSRYRRWAFGFGPHLRNQEIYKDTAIYHSDPESGEPLGPRRAGASAFGDAGSAGRVPMAAWPQVTFYSAVSEVPDETAHGPALEVVVQAAFANMLAAIKFLRDGRYAVERIEEDAGREATARTLLRVRPVLPTREGPGIGTHGK